MRAFVPTFSPLFMICFLTIFSCYFLPGMKVYITEEKELIMEPSLKWAGNPNVTVAVRAFGLKATVQVTELVLCFMKID